MQLPREIFEELPGEHQIISEAQSFYVIDRVDFEDGMRVFIRGAEYHQRGMAAPEVLFGLNIAKRILTEALNVALRWEFLPGVALSILKPLKWRIKRIGWLINSYNSIVWKILSPHFLKPKYMVPCARELRSMIYNFMMALGIREEFSNQSSVILSHFIEYDNAYRFRLEDLMSETNKEELAAKPIRTLRRLAKLAVERDQQTVGWKFKGIVTIASIALLLPSVRKAWKKMILESDFAKIQYDEIDRYWTAMRTDYLWWGRTPEERSNYLTGKKMPVPMPKAEYEALMATLANK